VLLIAAFLKKLTGTPLVLDIRDNWAIDPIHLSRGRFLKKIEMIMGKKIIGTADKVILVTESSKSNYLNRYSSLRKKFLLIPNGYDPEDIEIVDNTIDDSKFIITHAGMLDKIRDPRYLFKAVADITTQNKELTSKLEIILLGNVRLEYQNAITEMGLEHIIKCLGTVPHEECIKWLYHSSILLVIPSRNIPTAIPGKLYEYMAIGKPILALAESGQAKDFIVSNALGIAVPPDDVNSIKQAILDLYEKQKRGILKIKPNDKLLKRYDRRELTAQLSDVLNKVSKQH
jgi:glycosyltransferase involved in cell wall biosynthesis